VVVLGSDMASVAAIPCDKWQSLINGESVKVW